MHRAISAAVLAGLAVLVATKLASPAGSSPAPQSSTDSDRLPAELVHLNREVDRLRERLPAAAELEPPTRDPFTFGRARGASAGTAASEPAAAPTVIVPTLPRLVAILSEGDSSPARTAVLSFGDGVELYKVGDRAGELRVTRITDSAVIVASDALQQSFTLSLH